MNEFKIQQVSEHNRKFSFGLLVISLPKRFWTLRTYRILDACYSGDVLKGVACVIHHIVYNLFKLQSILLGRLVSFNKYGRELEGETIGASYSPWIQIPSLQSKSEEGGCTKHIIFLPSDWKGMAHWSFVGFQCIDFPTTYFPQVCQGLKSLFQVACRLLSFLMFLKIICD